MWIFIHNNDNVTINKNNNNKKENIIFNFDNKPKFLYNGKTFEIKLLKNDSSPQEESSIYTTNNLPIQKWNNIVMNYINGIIDIYINGSLVASKKSIIVSDFSNTKKITIGGTKGLIKGAICNIIYFSTALMEKQIKYNYDRLKFKSPPI